MTDGISLRNIVVSGSVFLDGDDEQILDILQNIRNIELPEEMDSQIVNIVEDNPKNSTLIFSDGLPQGPMIPQGSIELVTISVEEGDIDFNIDLDPVFIELARDVLDVILESHSVHITHFDLEYELDRSFSDLAITIEGPESVSFEGVKFRKADFSYIIQSSVSNWHIDEGAENETDLEDDETSTASVSYHDHLDVEESSAFIEDKIEQTRALLEEVQQ